MRPTSDAHDGTHSNRQLCYPDGLLGELQQVLGDLADIEDRYEADRNRLAQTTSTSGSSRARLSADVDRRYRAERAPYVERLERLAKEMIMAKVR
jgi:hypothetical protein